mmetsp:Transcript_72911/g.213634  ORF Transcript_72911/g.213634 Transcript_72911/m.213634 type:complete len:220 (+) Transcript_72911:485-1144(+)
MRSSLGTRSMQGSTRLSMSHVLMNSWNMGLVIFKCMPPSSEGICSALFFPYARHLWPPVAETLAEVPLASCSTPKGLLRWGAVPSKPMSTEETLCFSSRLRASTHSSMPCTSLKFSWSLPSSEAQRKLTRSRGSPASLKRTTSVKLAVGFKPAESRCLLGLPGLPRSVGSDKPPPARRRRSRGGTLLLSARVGPGGCGSLHTLPWRDSSPWAKRPGVQA